MTKPHSTTNLILVGPMGAGKTTIGRRLAKLLNRQLIDVDKEIEQRTGASIPLIFEMEGEQGFREREKSLTAELCKRPNIVLATGGGLVMDPDNRRCLAHSGFVVYLRTSLDEQIRRIGQDTNRPMLHTADRRIRLEQLLQIRDPLYRQVADFIIDTDGGNLKQISEEILKQLL
jgi:shikimate kinase